MSRRRWLWSTTTRLASSPRQEPPLWEGIAIDRSSNETIAVSLHRHGFSTKPLGRRVETPLRYGATAPKGARIVAASSASSGVVYAPLSADTAALIRLLHDALNGQSISALFGVDIWTAAREALDSILPRARRSGFVSDAECDRRWARITRLIALAERETSTDNERAVALDRILETLQWVLAAARKGEE